MTSVTREPVFKRHQKVVAAVDLPFVPAGTKGRIMHPVGVTWFRYHVEFETGRVVSSLDAAQLMTVDDWERKQQEQREAERQAKREERRKQLKQQQQEQAQAATMGGT
jgi:hypothetical protein